MELVDLSMRNRLDTSSVAQSLDGDRLKGSLQVPVVSKLTKPDARRKTWSREIVVQNRYKASAHRLVSDSLAARAWGNSNGVIEYCLVGGEDCRCVELAGRPGEPLTEAQIGRVLSEPGEVDVEVPGCGRAARCIGGDARGPSPPPLMRGRECDARD